MQSILGSVIKHNEDKLTAYHYAYLNYGLFLYIPKDTILTDPITISMAKLNTKKVKQDFPILISVAKTGILSVLFAVALLASGQNSTITGTLTGQVVMEGFIHLKMPLWARRLFTRLLSLIPVIICVLMTAKDSISEQHFARNMLLENSQVFLAFAVPFSIVPLLIMTDNKRMMGQFKNRKIWSILGWISSIILIFLNLCNLPATFVSFKMMPKRDAVVFWLMWSLC